MTENEQQQINDLVEKSFASLPEDHRKQVVLSAFLDETLGNAINLATSPDTSGGRRTSKMLKLHAWEQKNEKKVMAGMVAVMGVVAIAFPKFFATMGQYALLTVGAILSRPSGIYRRIKSDVIDDMEKSYKGDNFEARFREEVLPRMKEDLAAKFNEQVAAKPGQKVVELDIPWVRRNEFLPEYKGTWFTGPLWN